MEEFSFSEEGIKYGEAGVEYSVDEMDMIYPPERAIDAYKATVIDNGYEYFKKNDEGEWVPAEEDTYVTGMKQNLLNLSSDMFSDLDLVDYDETDFEMT